MSSLSSQSAVVSVVYNIAACYRCYNPNKILPGGRSLSIHKIADSSYLFSFNNLFRYEIWSNLNKQFTRPAHFLDFSFQEEKKSICLAGLSV